MDHLRHRSNLVNPACLLSLSKYGPGRAGYQALAGRGAEQNRKKSPFWELLVQPRPRRKGRDWKCTPKVDSTANDNASVLGQSISDGATRHR